MWSKTRIDEFESFCISDALTDTGGGGVRTYAAFGQSVTRYGGASSVLTVYVHIKTAEQRTIIQQYGNRYTGC